MELWQLIIACFVYSNFLSHVLIMCCWLLVFGYVFLYKLWVVKKSQLIFICNFVKNQWIVNAVFTVGFKNEW